MNFPPGKLLQAMMRKTRDRSASHCGLKRRPWNRVVPWLEALENRCLPSGGISLTPNEPAPQLVGEQIIWTAATADFGQAPVYQFRVAPENGPMRVVRDFSLNNSFTWTPMEEGTYDIQVIAKQGFNASETELADALDVVNSRITGTEAVITPTLNPLVALYSVPPTQPGPGPHGTVHVQFAVAGENPAWQSTNDLPSLPGRSTNFLVAGMLPNTTYEMRDVFSDGTTSAPLLFTTGAIPSTVNFPPITVVQPPGPGSDLNQDMLFQILARPFQSAPYVYATNLAGQVTWYYDPTQSGFAANNPAAGASLVPGGTVLVMGADSYATLPMSKNVLREIDLAGNPIRETSLDAVNAQLTALGHEIIYGFTHDVERLPNGNTVVLGLTERAEDINGVATNYVGTMIVVLDQNFQVAWAWDAFDFLDVNRGPVLGEVLQPGTREPTAAVPSLPAVDWLHSNSISWSPADHNLVLSLRHQDWVIKIDYENGTGDGHILWRLGQGGDFAVNSTDANPWFSHQHDAHYIDDSTLILFDNGNTRRASDPTADSRGQVWKLDEQTMTATLVVNVDLGNYSDRVGSAQVLSNGDYCFSSGAQGKPPFLGQSIEVRPDGTKNYVLQVGRALYRSFRVQTLYEGTDLPLGDRSDTSETVDPSSDRDLSASSPQPPLPDLGRLDDFWAAMPSGLAASPEQSAGAATDPAAQPITETMPSLAPFGDTEADPAFPDESAMAAAPASDPLLPDPGMDPWLAGLEDDLASVVIS